MLALTANQLIDADQIVVDGDDVFKFLSTAEYALISG